MEQIRVILVGYGKMGKLIAQTIDETQDMRVVGIVDVDQRRSFEEISEPADVVLDFSYPGNLEMCLCHAKGKGCPLVLGTTGLSAEQMRAIEAAAEDVPIVYSANYSLGIAVLRRALQLVAPAIMGDFDVEIVETHHRQKADAPSGTAKMLKAAMDPEGIYEATDGRSGITGARPQKQIGMHAIRGGTVAGEHSVLFLGDQELLELRHSASNRQVFVNGVIKAARFAATAGAGLYSIDDVLFGR